MFGFNKNFLGYCFECRRGYQNMRKMIEDPEMRSQYPAILTEMNIRTFLRNERTLDSLFSG